MNTTATAAAEVKRMSPGVSLRPVKAERSLSITPTTGFSPYTQRHRSSTSELGYATGDTSVSNGITYHTSR